MNRNKLDTFLYYIEVKCFLKFCSVLFFCSSLCAIRSSKFVFVCFKKKLRKLVYNYHIFMQKVTKFTRSERCSNHRIIFQFFSITLYEQKQTVYGNRTCHIHKFNFSQRIKLGSRTGDSQIIKNTSLTISTGLESDILIYRCQGVFGPFLQPPRAPLYLYVSSEDAGFVGVRIKDRVVFILKSFNILMNLI